jgi:hypothetical protein
LNRFYGILKQNLAPFFIQKAQTMTNQTLFFLTALVLIAIAVLFALNIKSVVRGKPLGEYFLKYNEVRGIAVQHNDKLYTLNFKEQNAVIEILNRATPITKIDNGSRTKPDFQKIVIYQFNNKPDLIVTPITYLDNNLIFSQPAWDKENNLIEMSDGELQKILSQSYDK